MQKMGWFGVVRGHSRSTAMSPFDRARAYDFLFNFNRNHAFILYRFRDIASYLSKVTDFHPPHLHSAPSQGVTPVEFRGDLWHQKTRVFGVSCGVVYVILRLAVFVELRLVTDRRTRTQTQAHGQYRGCIASRGKNCAMSLICRRNVFSCLLKVSSVTSLDCSATGKLFCTRLVHYSTDSKTPATAACPKIWNGLPEDVTCARSLLTFVTVYNKQDSVYNIRCYVKGLIY